MAAQDLQTCYPKTLNFTLLVYVWVYLRVSLDAARNATVYRSVATARNAAVSGPMEIVRNATVGEGNVN